MGCHLSYKALGEEKIFLKWEPGREIKNSALDILSLKCLEDIKSEKLDNPSVEFRGRAEQKVYVWELAYGCF